jgi:chemotaxis protein MotB
VSDPGGVKVVFIKKKNKGHGHHGGAWKVAYADFVTAMMALFIVLWLLTQSDQASKEKIAEYFRTGAMPGGALMVGKPGGSTPPRAINIFPDGQGEAAAAVADNRGLQALAREVEAALGKVAKNPEYKALAKHVKVRVVNEGALIELVEGGDNFLFNVASSDLKPGAIKILEELAPLLKSLNNRIEIHGHTDARPFGSGSKKTNWELSFERGDQARRVLEGRGIEKGKIQSVLAHADTALYRPDQPLAPENRRLSILVVRASAQRARAGLNQPAKAKVKDLDDQADDGAEKKNRALDDDAPVEKSRKDLDDEDAPTEKPRRDLVDEDEPIKPQAPIDEQTTAPSSKSSRAAERDKALKDLAAPAVDEAAPAKKRSKH